ncbi:MAG: helix-turn-helix domain-containing protein [Micromonosporaceae bacterium]|nr:helix-turn-helix domain-containing protein [Micromonosporaceae bacterium]
METQRMWTHAETAAYLGIREQTLYFLNHKGKGPRYYKVGRYCRYRPTDIDHWLTTRQATPTT